MTSHIALALAGIACLAISVTMVVRLKARPGRPPSPWVSTDTRASASAMAVLSLGLLGITLVAKAFT